jgi:exo-1,4-beta-D-glucosaminidase
MKLPRFPEISPVFFVRCELLDEKGRALTENVYWQSQRDDDVGDPKNDGAFGLKPDSWADMTSLNSMPKAPLEISAMRAGSATDGGRRITIRLHNPTQHVGFFEHAEVTSAKDGDEILPIEYDNNYVTVFPGESVEIRATLPANASWIKLEGFNTPQSAVPIK